MASPLPFSVCCSTVCVCFEPPYQSPEKVASAMSCAQLCPAVLAVTLRRPCHLWERSVPLLLCCATKGTQRDWAAQLACVSTARITC